MDSSSASIEEKVCPEHGPYRIERNALGLLRGWGSWCPPCLARRQAEHEARAEADQRIRMEKDKASRKAARLARCGAEGRYTRATFSTFKVSSDAQRRALKICAEFASTFTPTSGLTLFLIGPPGTGKTHLLAAMVRHVIEHHDKAAEMMNGLELVRVVRSTWGKRDESENEAIAGLGSLPLLAIDEIGLTSPTEAELRILFEIVDKRYTHGRPTIVASNLNLVQIGQTLGERIFDRLAENHRVVVMNWPSYRTAGV